MNRKRERPRRWTWPAVRRSASENRKWSHEAMISVCWAASAQVASRHWLSDALPAREILRRACNTLEPVKPTLRVPSLVSPIRDAGGSLAS